MKRFKFSIYFLAFFVTWFIYIVSFSGCSGNEGESIVVPEYEGIGPPPLEATVSQVYADYLADEENADVKYGKEKLLFSGVEVEELFGDYYQMAEALGAGDQSYVKLYFTAGTAKFRLREEYFGIMQNIEEGYILNIIGECEGLQDGLVFIDDCWVESVVGDIGTGEEPDFY